MGAYLDKVIALTPVHVRAHRRWNPLSGLFEDVDEYWRDSLFNKGDRVELLSRAGMMRGSVLSVTSPDAVPTWGDVPAEEPRYRIRWDNRAVSEHWERELGKVFTAKWGIPPAERGIRVGWSRESR